LFPLSVRLFSTAFSSCSTALGASCPCAMVISTIRKMVATEEAVISFVVKISSLGCRVVSTGRPKTSVQITLGAYVWHVTCLILIAYVVP